jgi:hypothetical protein
LTAAVVIGLATTGTAVGGTAYVLSTPTSEPASVPSPPPQRTRSDASVTKVVPTSVQPAALGRIVPPDFLVVADRSLSKATLARVSRLKHVRDIITADAGAVSLQGGRANMFAVDPGTFRGWTPPGTAKNDRLWSALAAGRFVVSPDVQRQLGLRESMQYPIVGRVQVMATMGGSGSLGLPGINVLVGRDAGRRLGLVPGIVLLVNAPGANLGDLQMGLRKIVGRHSQIINLNDKQYQPAQHGRAGSYLELYKQAATTCPGLSWTVLAAIGQIESDHGRNTGPSSAGALGPMQFMPATWRTYGVDGDGDGKADIMDPYDAVPAAARYLCASGAGRGGAGLSRAVWAYNHSQAYVNAVLSLAQAYARRYS